MSLIIIGINEVSRVPPLRGQLVVEPFPVRVLWPRRREEVVVIDRHVSIFGAVLEGVVHLGLSEA
jgi:hypothetical protein